jgi:ubiquinone/menaquinone biosynthesis C-methylase UbiE
MGPTRDFVPALRLHRLTGAYDRVVGLVTREQRWRAELLRRLAPTASDRIVDVGCGTGTFALMVARACPMAGMIAVDPDEAILKIASAKPGAASVDWRRGHGDELGEVLEGRSMTKVVSSLVLHQCPLETKTAILRSMFEVLEPGGQLFIADYGLQRTLLMRTLFRTVQILDGFALTQPNADGRLPQLMRGVGFARVEEAWVLPTPTGSISVYRAERS